MDCGPGVLAQLLERRALRDLDGVLISHGHADLPGARRARLALRYAPAAERGGLPLHIPPGMERQLDALGEVFHDDAGDGPREDYWSPALERRTYDPALPLALPGVTVTFAPTRHYVPCWAMQFHGRAGPGHRVRRRRRAVRCRHGAGVRRGRAHHGEHVSVAAWPRGATWGTWRLRGPAPSPRRPARGGSC
ncbi:MAG: MBL fold metallo-hydrolase [Anaerolineae bacterium]